MAGVDKPVEVVGVAAPHQRLDVTDEVVDNVGVGGSDDIHDLDRRGKQGTEVLNAFKAGLK